MAGSLLRMGGLARTVPRLGARKPSRTSMVVVFPAPFGPSTAATWPAGTSKLMSSTAVKQPKRLTRCSTSMAVNAASRRRGRPRRRRRPGR